MNIRLEGARRSPDGAPELIERGVPFGRTPDRQLVHLYTLRNGRGLVVRVMDYGATLVGIEAPDRTGSIAQVVLGAGEFEPYVDGFPAAGSTIGRVANRIAGAAFELDGRPHRVDANEGRNSLHGGDAGFAHRLWRYEPCAHASDATCARFRLTSDDGDGGYPGNVAVMVTFALTAENELRIEYDATCDRATPLNLTNHAYFNLAGAGDVLDHELWADADGYTPIDRELIPTGAIESVAGTPFDFRTPRRIGARIAALEADTRGYDHNLVLRRSRDAGAPCLRLRHRTNGRVLEVRTTEPGVQLYTANHFDHVVCWGGVRYPRHGGVCLETQHFPDAVHHPDWPSVILRPEIPFHSTTVYHFTTD